jgi:hypothetical protein
LRPDGTTVAPDATGHTALWWPRGLPCELYVRAIVEREGFMQSGGVVIGHGRTRVVSYRHTKGINDASDATGTGSYRAAVPVRIQWNTPLPGTRSYPVDLTLVLATTYDDGTVRTTRVSGVVSRHRRLLRGCSIGEGSPMRVRRTVYLVIFIVASLVAAGAYWLAQPRTQVVRATVDVPVGGAATGAMASVTLGQGLTILALRSTEIRDLTVDPATTSTGAIPPKLGSVVVAIPAARLPEFVTAALTLTFYLGLNPRASLVTADP